MIPCNKVSICKNVLEIYTLTYIYHIDFQYAIFWFMSTNIKFVNGSMLYLLNYNIDITYELSASCNYMS